MSVEFKNRMLNEWIGLDESLVDSLELLRKIILSCYDLGKEEKTSTIIHFKDDLADAEISLSIADGTTSIRFEYTQATSNTFNSLFENTGLTYDALPDLEVGDLALVMDMLADDFFIRKLNLQFHNFASVGSFYLSVRLDPIDEYVIDLISQLLSKNSSATINKKAPN